ncbi:MAG TPA: hypothetical protein ENI66_01355 [Candidatus Yonathbacteria bacterium]|nr:hypothetical protein [Candidatus Yonathbacteria bacterium]
MLFGKKKKTNTQSAQPQKPVLNIPVPQKTVDPAELKPVRTFEEDMAEAIAKRDKEAENKRAEEDMGMIKTTPELPEPSTQTPKSTSKASSISDKAEGTEKIDVSTSQETEKNIPKSPVETTNVPKTPPKKEEVPTNKDPRTKIQKQLEDISNQKKIVHEEMKILDVQLHETEGAVERFTKEKKSINLQLAPIKEQEELVESSIVEIEKHEAATSSMEERHSFEKQRWDLEDGRKKLESQKWELSKEVEKIEDSIHKSEATHTEIQIKKNNSIEQLQSLDKQEDRIHLEFELSEISQKKQALELQWIKFSNKQKEEESLLDTTMKEEFSIEKQKKIVEGKEHAAESSQEERGFEEERQDIESKRRGLEEKRWKLEETLSKTKTIVEKLKPEYQDALGEEERLNKTLEVLDTK